jgi:hypothetical protein
MRDEPKGVPPTPTPPAKVTPQLQGPPNYPGPGGKPNLNPPFDSRLTSTGGANPAMKDRPLKRGRIIRADGGYQVNFMFNPSVLNVAFTYDQSLANQANTDPSVTAAYVGEGQISVDLLFDRTYEVWERHYDIAGQFGVHGDVLAFWAFLDMIPADFTNQSSWEALYPRSQLVRKDSYLYVGDRLKYYGYISDLSLQYVHWSYDMIPTRAAISLGFNVIFSSPTTTTSSSSGSTSSSSGNTKVTNPTKLPNQPNDSTLGGLVP